MPRPVQHLRLGDNDAGAEHFVTQNQRAQAAIAAAGPPQYVRRDEQSFLHKVQTPWPDCMPDVATTWSRGFTALTRRACRSSAQAFAILALALSPSTFACVGAEPFKLQLEAWNA
eukprot:6212686-Pleurochrysis_carterae.AAC.7